MKSNMVIELDEFSYEFNSMKILKFMGFHQIASFVD